MQSCFVCCVRSIYPDSRALFAKYRPWRSCALPCHHSPVRGFVWDTIVCEATFPSSTFFSFELPLVMLLRQPSVLLLLCSLVPSTMAVGLRGWLLRSGSGGSITILRRQPLRTAPLPGEALALHLDSAAASALHQAVENDFGMFAMELITPNGNIPSVAPLLEVKKISEGYAGSFAEVSCVGRARLRERRGDGKATVSPFRDADLDPGRTETGLSTLRRVIELHDACHALDNELTELADRLQVPEVAPMQQQAHELQQNPIPRVFHLGETAAPDPPAASATVRMARRPARFRAPLRELVARHQETLLSQAAAQCMLPSPSLERLPLWAGSDAPHAASDAKLVLASFAASASLSSFERLRCVTLIKASHRYPSNPHAHGAALCPQSSTQPLQVPRVHRCSHPCCHSALETTLTIERLQCASRALERERDRLGAMLALRRVSSTGPLNQGTMR